jgi:hypothetical protein
MFVPSTAQAYIYGAYSVRVDDGRHEFLERFSPSTNPRGMNFGVHENGTRTVLVEMSTRKGETQPSLHYAVITQKYT